MERIEAKVGSPAVMVAIITTMGVFFSSSAAFAGVVFAPVIKSWLGIP